MIRLLLVAAIFIAAFIAMESSADACTPQGSLKEQTEMLKKIIWKVELKKHIPVKVPRKS